MKHKIRVRQGRVGLWYAKCLGCQWEPGRTHSKKFGHIMWGRDTWDAAFAVGVAHQKNADLKEKLTA